MVLEFPVVFLLVNSPGDSNVCELVTGIKWENLEEKSCEIFYWELEVCPHLVMEF